MYVCVYMQIGRRFITYELGAMFQLCWITYTVSQQLDNMNTAV